MAVVYLVHQPALDRDVVLKRLDLEGRDPALAQRFVREARLAATLDHPNVVTLFDFFEHDGVPYIAMEYVAGGSLRGLVGRLELPQVCGVVEGVLAGLQHAEARRIAHRDLKGGGMPSSGFRPDVEGLRAVPIVSVPLARAEPVAGLEASARRTSVYSAPH